jgi:hypothetical protein
MAVPERKGALARRAFRICTLGGGAAALSANRNAIRRWAHLQLSRRLMALEKVESVIAREPFLRTDALGGSIGWLRFHLFSPSSCF